MRAVRAFTEQVKQKERAMLDNLEVAPGMDVACFRVRLPVPF